MADINKCVLTGRLGADPELKQTTSGKAVCNFRIAVTRPKAKGAETAEVDWFEIVTWDGIAELSARHLSKGQKITVIGCLRTRTWADTKGGKHREVELHAEQVVFMSAKLPQANQFSAGNTSDNYEELASDDDLPY